MAEGDEFLLASAAKERHETLQKTFDLAIKTLREEMAESWVAHFREHGQVATLASEHNKEHWQDHERAHVDANRALDKAHEADLREAMLHWNNHQLTHVEVNRALDKASESVDKRIEEAKENADKLRDAAEKRLGALERGESGSIGRTQGDDRRVLAGQFTTSTGLAIISLLIAAGAVLVLLLKP